MAKMVAPSILASDFGHLANDIEMINGSNADFLHIDIMDGVFVPNISFGFPVLKHVKQYAKKPLDVHLMIVNPDQYIEKFHNVGAHILNVHYEACNHLHRTVHAIKDLGMKAGVTLNPHTPVHLLEDIIADLDLVLIMSVNPGYGGQVFIENTYNKIAALKALIIKKNSNAWIEVDGGVDLSNAGKLYETGVDILVAGTTVFKAKDPVKMVAELKTK